ncbi:MAG: proprotein convertase P-domain-containing protein [Saprospiraceae bacterium]|nr:proprotein convertase P-domain-containing protein [Saprospiraceae bacterium]
MIFVWCFSLYGTSQCGLSKTSYLIADFSNDKADTTNIPILISGAINNNLVTAQQGLCGVKLKFRHPYMKDLRIELVSPGGQKITLVGGTYAQQATMESLGMSPLYHASQHLHQIPVSCLNGKVISNGKSDQPIQGNIMHISIVWRNLIWEL